MLCFIGIGKPKADAEQIKQKEISVRNGCTLTDGEEQCELLMNRNFMEKRYELV